MNKNHAGAKKRFRITRTGKVLCKKGGKSHLLSKKSSVRKRRLRKKNVLPRGGVKKIMSILSR